jgi:hypothetical protein
MNSLLLEIYVHPRDKYLAYPAKLCLIPPWMWMALMYGYMFFESIELFPPLTISMTFFSPNQQRFLLFLALYP